MFLCDFSAIPHSLLISVGIILPFIPEHEFSLFYEYTIQKNKVNAHTIWKFCFVPITTENFNVQQKITKCDLSHWVNSVVTIWQMGSLVPGFIIEIWHGRNYKKIIVLMHRTQIWSEPARPGPGRPEQI